MHSGLDATIQLPLLCLGSLGRLTPDDAVAALLRWKDQLRTVDRATDTEFGHRVMTAIKWYCLSLTEIPSSQLKEAFEHLLERPEEEIMSTADKLLREGEARGVAIGEARGEARGETKGRAIALRTLITKRFGAPTPDIDERISGASIAELDRLTERILDVASVEDLFAD